MRFAILGDHRDGWAMARALVSRGHALLVYQGTIPAEQFRADWPTLRSTADLEEVLADPQVEAVIVAGHPGERLDQLRRVLQSERPALCVHPVDGKPDGAYEMNMLQGDTHQVALPLLPEACLPQIEGLRPQLSDDPVSHTRAYLVELTIADACDFLFEAKDVRRSAAAFPGWALLRHLAGEIVEVAGYTTGEAVEPGWPILVHGRFESGCLFRTLYAPAPFSSSGHADVAVHTLDAEPVRVVLSGSADPAWQRLAAHFEEAVARLKTTPRPAPGAGPAPPEPGAVSWLDEIRALELDDATRRSIERRRAYALEYQEASEDVGFKGTMTLVGCALLWLAPVLFVVAGMFPTLGWVIVPILLCFLGLQLLRWLVPAPSESSNSPPPE